MKGVKFLTNAANERIAVQIDLKDLNKFQGEIEDLPDAIISDSRREDEEESWGSVRDNLSSKGKLP